MGRWFFVIGLALAMAAPGCKGKGARDKGEVITEQPTDIEPGPGGRKVKHQAKEIGEAIKEQMASGTSWDSASVDKYSQAVQDALVEWVQGKGGLTKDQQKELIDAFPEYRKYGLGRTVSSAALPWYVDGAKYAVKMYAARIPVNEATQEKIDGQIDAFCDALQPALRRYFGERSSKEALTKVVAEIRKVCKDCSRNPWCAALKEPLDPKEENETRDQIAQGLMTSLNQWTEREKEGKKLNFDWGVTAAWSTATKFVSKSIKPPTDRALIFTHSPHGPILGFQVRPPMMQPSPTGPTGGAPPAGGPLRIEPTAPPSSSPR